MANIRYKLINGNFGMIGNDGYLNRIILGTVIVIITNNLLVSGRFCEGGHRCSPPKECCAQGCCYLYAPPSAPRSPPPAADHVLNLFFINHWYFWCVVVAIILAILCACSLWRKRRQLCGWGSPGPHSQSGDSAGSCYAPPQYSRCSSFHHAPPPYTEVTTKPDLYPLVFTCNGDNGKTGSGASYLMVQYFRNYIVRPAGGSLSATSTVDSLSSSFICNANEANTLVPPPYSRAASPDQQLTNSNYQQSLTSAYRHQLYASSMSRSASQNQSSTFTDHPFVSNEPSNGTTSVIYRPASMHVTSTSSIQLRTLSNDDSGDDNEQQLTTIKMHHLHNQFRMSESVNFNLLNFIGIGSSPTTNQPADNVTSSHSDQLFHYNIPPTTSISNNESLDLVITNGSNENCVASSSGTNRIDLPIANSEFVISQSNHAQDNKKISNSSYTRGNSTNLTYNGSTYALYNSCGSVDGTVATTSTVIPPNISITNGMPTSQESEVLSRSLENYCQPNLNRESSKRYETLRSYVNSTTGSSVSSLANIGTPGSPPQATSPTGEVRELLEQIRHLQTDDVSTNMVKLNELSGTEPTTPYTPNIIATTTPSPIVKTKRPSTLHSRKDFFTSTKSRYFQIGSNSSNTIKSLRSPISVAASSLLNRTSSTAPSTTASQSNNRTRRKGWISRSAPTTPGTINPVQSSCFLDDDSPLLNEHDEEFDEQT